MIFRRMSFGYAESGYPQDADFFVDVTNEIIANRTYTLRARNYDDD